MSVILKSYSSQESIDLNCFTGKWRLNHKVSKPQEAFMTGFKRSWAIQKVIDGADEDFYLFQYGRLNEEGANPVFYKKVTIYADTNLYAWLAVFVKALGFDKVNYAHVLLCDGTKQNWAADEKQFGPCYSVCKMEVDEETKLPMFVTRWYIGGPVDIDGKVLQNKSLSAVLVTTHRLRVVKADDGSYRKQLSAVLKLKVMEGKEKKEYETEKVYDEAECDLVKESLKYVDKCKTVSKCAGLELNVSK